VHQSLGVGEASNPRSSVSRGGSWTLSERSLVLARKAIGRHFMPREYSYDGDTTIKGFSIRNPEIPWVRLEDVDFIQ
jgi:hypothetical protein